MGWRIVKHTISRHDVPPCHRSMPGKQQKLSGKVLKFGSNHDGDIDRILLSSGQKNVWLHFPPHTARMVTSVAEINKLVEVTVDEKAGPGHEANNTYELKYLRSQSEEVGIDLPKIPAPAPRKGLEVEIKGRPPKDFNFDNERESTFILEGKLISLPPHMARELLPLISQAKMVVVKGYMRDTTEGFLTVSGIPLVKPGSIQIDNANYIIR